MWTSIAGIVGMIAAAIIISPLALWAFLIWVLFSRLFFSLVLFAYAGRVDMSFPFLLYANQVGLALVKIYILFRLPMQRWANRGDQRAYCAVTLEWKLKKLAAAGVNAFWVLVFLFSLLIYLGILQTPTHESLRSFTSFFR